MNHKGHQYFIFSSLLSLLPLTFKYSPQHHTLEHPPPADMPELKRPSFTTK